MEKELFFNISFKEIEEILRSKDLTGNEKITGCEVRAGGIRVKIGPKYSEKQWKLLNTPIKELDISVRLYRALKISNHENLLSLINKQDSEMERYGKKSLDELRELFSSVELGMIR
jgi:DNA-directed RNA polymerase alpha subunit